MPPLAAQNRLLRIASLVSRQLPHSSATQSLAAALGSPLLSSRTMASAAAAKRLAGKTVLITGASSGIGRSTALEFARTGSQGLRLILAARRLDSLRQLADQITAEAGRGVEILAVRLDVSKPDEVRDFVGNLPEEWRDIHILVNNA